MTPEETAYLIRALTEAPKWQEHSKQERERQVAHHVRAAVEAETERAVRACESVKTHRIENGHKMAISAGRAKRECIAAIRVRKEQG